MIGYLLLLMLLSLTKLAYSDENYRLNVPISPSSYAISITPHFDTGDELAFTFDGEVTISLTTTSATNQIKLHSENLTFTSANITVSTANLNAITLNSTNPLVFDEIYTFAFINLASELQPGIEYILNIAYRGPIRSDLNGFYRNYYVENGVTKWLGATQMEPTHARKVFPSFDEPALKATFTLTIDRPESFQPTLANTKLQSSVALSNGYVRETFYPSPRMSTYLVAFLISEFTAARYNISGNREFGVYTRPDAATQAQFTFDFGIRVVEALGDYFGIDYYSTNSNLKLDHIALPDFRAGAMENWGLIKYREARLLYVPEESTPVYKYGVAQIMAHETTHMWFGNLVTCHWWSNTWLNEGFANYFEDHITSLIEPDVGSADIMVTESLYSAYDADDDPDSVPISNNNVNSPAEISGHFGTITYSKAGSIIRMMHHLIGDEAFRFGLHAYLEANQFDSGYPELMYQALDQGVSATNALAAYPGLTVGNVMSSWISQAGHPVLDVNVDYENDTVTLTQKRFYIDSEHESSEIYQIPITYTTEIAPDFDNTKPAFIMNETSHTFIIPNISLNHSWVIFNLQETGFYRVNYDDHSWQMLSSALKGDQREQIHHLNRAKIINDLFAFLYADVVEFDRLYDILEFLSEETNYSVWNAAIRGLRKLRGSYFGTDVLSTIEAYEIRLLDSIITRLGYEANPTEGTVALRNRMQVLEYACRIGHQGCIDSAVALFRALRENGTEISPSLRPVAYCTGLQYGNGEDFDFLWNRMTTTNLANEGRIILDALGCTTEVDRLRQYLASVLEANSPIRSQDVTVPLTSILAHYNNVHLVLDELQENYNQWSTIYPRMDTVLTTIASALHTDEEFSEFENWMSSCTQCSESIVEATRKSLDAARHAATWAQNHRSNILESLSSNALTKLPSLSVLVFGLIIAFFKF